MVVMHTKSCIKCNCPRLLLLVTKTVHKFKRFICVSPLFFGQTSQYISCFFSSSLTKKFTNQINTVIQSRYLFMNEWAFTSHIKIICAYPIIIINVCKTRGMATFIRMLKPLSWHIKLVTTKYTHMWFAKQFDMPKVQYAYKNKNSTIKKGE